MDFKFPIDLVRADRAGEKISYIIENLFVAQVYTILKKAGIEKIQTEGKITTTDQILELYPGLKDYVKNNGFSPHENKDIRAIGKIASVYFDTNRQADYWQQHYEHTLLSGESGMFQRLQYNDAKYNEVLNSMLKNVYIGNNTNVNLSCCRDLISMSASNALDLMENMNISDRALLMEGKYTPMTYGKAKEISDYLETIGLHNPDEKNDYMQKTLADIVCRSGHTDEKLKSILLNTKSVNSGKIVYADGLVEKNDGKGNHYIVGKDGVANIALYEQFKSLQEKISNTTSMPMDITDATQIDTNKDSEITTHKNVFIKTMTDMKSHQH